MLELMEALAYGGLTPPRPICRNAATRAYAAAPSPTCPAILLPAWSSATCNIRHNMQSTIFKSDKLIVIYFSGERIQCATLL
jgi:hypothetical protein